MSGQLVEQWPIKNIGEVLTTLRNGLNCKQNKSGEGTPVSRIETISHAEINYEKVGYSEISEEQKEKFRLCKGDILFSHINSPIHVGKTALVTSDQELIHGVNLLLFRTSDEVLPAYLNYYLIHIFKSGYWLRNCKQSVNQASVNQTDIKKVTLPIPPLEEQQQIVSILDEVFENIQRETVQIENKLLSAKGLFQSKLQSIFNARDDNWEDFTFDEIIQSRLIGLVRNNKSQSDEYPYRYLKMNNIGNDNSFNESNIVNVQATPSEVEKFSLRNGDFLFNTRNSYELVGKICIFQSEAVAPTLFNNNIMRVRFTNEINPSFVALAFSSEGIVDQLEKMKSGTTSVVGIYYKSLRELRIHIPSLSEQNAIVDSLGLLMSKTQSLKEIYQFNLDSYSELKQSILQEAFNGTLRIAEGLAGQS